MKNIKIIILRVVNVSLPKKSNTVLTHFFSSYASSKLPKYNIILCRHKHVP